MSDVDTSGEERRPNKRWPKALKREIIAATCRPDALWPLVDELEALMRTERPKLSRGSDLAKAMNFMLRRWYAFTRFLDDDSVCLSNNAAERGLRGIALG